MAYAALDIRDAARGSQLLEQHRADDHLPARGLRSHCDAPDASQPGRASCCATSPPSTRFAGEHGQLLAHGGENSADTPRIGIDCEADRSPQCRASMCRRAAKVRADLALAVRRNSGRVRIDRIQLSDGVSVRTVSRLDVCALRRRAGRVARAARQGEPPPEATSGGIAPSVHRAGDEESAGLREFRHGDPPRQVAWTGIRARPRPAGEDL